MMTRDEIPRSNTRRRLAAQMSERCATCGFRLDAISPHREMGTVWSATVISNDGKHHLDCWGKQPTAPADLELTATEVVAIDKR